MVDENDFRNENEHMHQNYEFQSAELEILDANGENTIGAIDMKKGEKYIVQIDLHEELVTGYEEKDHLTGRVIFKSVHRTGSKIRVRTNYPRLLIRRTYKSLGKNIYRYDCPNERLISRIAK